LSSLADAGCDIDWITGAHKRTLDESVEREVLNPKIRITRIAAPRVTGLAKLRLEMLYQVHAPHLAWVTPAVAATRKKLAEIHEAILLTRSMPVVSNIVGHYCRNQSAAWIAHFSDPYPFSFTPNRGFATSVAMLLHHRWAKQIVHHADLITATCRNAIRYMEQRLSMKFEDRALVLTHLGLPKLMRGGTKLDRTANEFWLAHFGALMTHRNPEVLLSGMSRAAERVPGLRFLQLGHIDSKVTRPRGCDTFIRLKDDQNLNPRDASDMREQVDVNVIVDADIGVEYSPFVASKYPHSVCSGRPLLMITHSDSAMGEYTRAHGGGVVASFRDASAVETAIMELHQAWNNGDRRFTPSQELMWQFSPEVVVKPFIERMRNLLRENRI
jgi:hypothetical protein